MEILEVKEVLPDGYIPLEDIEEGITFDERAYLESQGITHMKSDTATDKEPKVSRHKTDGLDGWPMLVFKRDLAS